MVRESGQRLRKSEKILCILLLVFIIFGHVIKLGNVKVLGLTITLYRVGIPLLAWYYFVKTCMNKRQNLFNLNRTLLLFILVMCYWFIIGCGMMLISQYSPLNDGIKELLNLLLGLFSVFCIVECCNKRVAFEYFLKLLKIIVSMLCLAGFVEMLIGFHLPSSKYFNYFSAEQFWSLFFRGLSTKQFFPVTSIFYGINDFASFLAIFFPLFFIEKSMKTAVKMKNVVVMIGVAFILLVGDANIAYITVAIGVIFMLALKIINRYFVGSFAIILFMQQWGAQCIAKVLFGVKSWFGSLGAVERIISEQVNLGSIWDSGAVASLASTGEVIAVQMETAGQGYGSLYTRIMVMKDSIDMWLNSCLLGVGPSGYTHYLKKNGSRIEIVNPHNLWFEILSQYGIFVFVIYVGMLLYIFIKNIKFYFESKDFILAQILCILVSYVFASIAPSNFLNYSYQWIVPALGIVLIKLHSKNKKIVGDLLNG